MKEPTRWKVEELNCCFDADMIQSPTGEYVEYSDYKQLQADNERLRQAVTYLCSTMEVNGIHDNGDIGMHDRAIALGRAALKEGHNR